MDKDEIIDMKIDEIKEMMGRMDKRLDTIEDRLWAIAIGSWSAIGAIVGFICLMTQILTMS